jgi:hypothetical protein
MKQLYESRERGSRMRLDSFIIAGIHADIDTVLVLRAHSKITLHCYVLNGIGDIP